MEHLGLVHLEKHTGDLGGGGGLDGVDEGVEGLAEEHALLVLGGVGELRRELLDGQRKGRALLFGVGALIAAVLVYNAAPSSQYLAGLPLGSWLLGALALTGFWRSR